MASYSHSCYKNDLYVSLILCLSHGADGRGYALDAMTKVCPTCRGIGRVSALKIRIDDQL